MSGRTGAGVALVVALATAGCTRPQETQDERIQRQAAESARQVRHDAQNAGAEARKAARQAGREAKDIIAGVRQGWQEGAPAPKGAQGDGAVGAGQVEINTASLAQLEALPGVGPRTARRIVAERPYKAPGDLLRRGIVTHEEYARVEDRVVVRGR